MILLNSCIEQIKRLGGFVFNKPYSSIMPEGFSIAKLVPTSKHRYALNQILRLESDAYGLIGGRGSLKSSLMMSACMVLSMQGRGDTVVVCRSPLSARGAYDTFLWSLKVSGVKNLGWECSVHNLTCKYTCKNTRSRVVFICDKWENQVLRYQLDSRVKFILADDVDFKDCGAIEALHRNSINKRTLISNFSITNSDFFISKFYRNIRNFPTFFFSYTDVPKYCLGDGFFKGARLIKRAYPKAYASEYVGIALDRDGNTINLKTRFPNLK